MKTSLSPAPHTLDPAAAEAAADLNERAVREEELRAMRALRILLESKLIDQLEFERRLASFHDKAKA